MTRATIAARTRSATDGHWRPVLVVLVGAALVVGGCSRTSWFATPSAGTAAGASNALPSAATSARPSAAPRPQDVAVAAFVEQAMSGTWSYRVSFKGVAAATADSLPTAGRMDVSGEDFASSFTYDYSKEYAGVGKIRVQVRAVNGKGYSKTDTDAWKTVRGYRDEDTNIPFAGIRSVRDVKYLGPADYKGNPYHKVSVPNAVIISPTTIIGDVHEERIRRLTLELLIDDTGRPVSGNWRLSATARVQGQLQEVAYNLDLTFSKVGEKLSIKKP